MNLHIIIPALLMAVAAISGLIFIYRWGAFNGDTATQAQVDLYNTRSVANAHAETALKAARCAELADARAEAAEQQVKDLVSQLPQYGRDPKTGRFMKKET